jgi:hypothetical protein
MSNRRILRLDGGKVTVAQESRFESELRLHKAISLHPEVLPVEDLGLGTLVTLADELDLGHGPMDSLAVDPQGRLVIIEFKKGTENPDVRKVVAQLLDYASALWRLGYDDLEEACSRTPGDEGGLVERVAARLEGLGLPPTDPDAFRLGLQSCLTSGEFVFLYVARDLDERTRRIMTYLAEGAKMWFFAVEVDYFHEGDGDTSVLVPRTAFVPSWMSDGIGAVVPDRPPSASIQKMWELMEVVAEDLDLVTGRNRKGRLYRPFEGSQGVGVYRSGREVEFDMRSLREGGADDVADVLTRLLSEYSGRDITARQWPSVPSEPLVANWAAVRAKIIEPYFAARRLEQDRSD